MNNIEAVTRKLVTAFSYFRKYDSLNNNENENEINYHLVDISITHFRMRVWLNH